MKLNRGRKLTIGLLALVVLTGCRANTQSNEIAVHVTGYDLIPTSAVVKDCVQPSTNKYIGFGDHAYTYPAGQRSFTFDSKNGSDFPPISIVSKDNVTMTLSGTISFFLNTDCDTLKKFHKKIGSKNWGGHPAYLNDTDQGWVNMLDVELGKPLQNSLTDDASNYGYLDLYTRAAVRQDLERTLATTLEQRVKELTGGDYFQHFQILLNKPVAPDNIVQALEDSQAAVQENLAQKNRNTTALTSYAQIAQCRHLGLSEQTCSFLYAVNSGKVPYVVPPGGSAVLQQPAGK